MDISLLLRAVDRTADVAKVSRVLSVSHT